MRQNVWNCGIWMVCQVLQLYEMWLASGLVATEWISNLFKNILLKNILFKNILHILFGKSASKSSLIYLLLYINHNINILGKLLITFCLNKGHEILMAVHLLFYLAKSLMSAHAKSKQLTVHSNWWAIAHVKLTIFVTRFERSSILIFSI